MAERPAVNASPLILLARAGLLEFLQLAGPEIVVPSAAADEIRREGPNDPAVRALVATRWLKVVEAPPLPAVIQGWDLGAGESAVLLGARTSWDACGRPRPLRPGGDGTDEGVPHVVQ